MAIIICIVAILVCKSLIREDIATFKKVLSITMVKIDRVTIISVNQPVWISVSWPPHSHPDSIIAI